MKMAPAAERPPYFDVVFEKMRKNPAWETALGLNVHWGYWEDPSKATGTVDDFAAAGVTMTEQVCEAARVHDGMSILDAGCGFGGTIDYLNKQHSNLRLVGLNIDERQLERARMQVSPRTNNVTEFVHGDACNLAFPDSSFDVVMAVECIFHFPSRLSFLKHARRVLKPNGRLIVSDMLIQEPLDPLFALTSLVPNPAGRQFYISRSMYGFQARLSGLRIVAEREITPKVLPTVQPLLKLLTADQQSKMGIRILEYITGLYQKLLSSGAMTYRILTFQART